MQMAVCDDDPRDLLQIRNLFDKIKSGYDLEISYFESGEKIISCLENGGVFSFILLDIYMTGLNGINTAYRVRELLPKAQIAFLTSSKEHALEAFDLGALHYIIKPVTEDKLQEVLERFFGRVRRTVPNIELKSKTKTYTFNMLQVQKIASCNKGVDVYLKNGDTMHIPETFSAIENQLDGSVFLKISRGLAVNMSYILCMTGDICRFKDGTETLISRRNKNDIRRRYNDYLFDTKGGQL